MNDIPLINLQLLCGIESAKSLQGSPRLTAWHREERCKRQAFLKQTKLDEPSVPPANIMFEIWTRSFCSPRSLQKRLRNLSWPWRSKWRPRRTERRTQLLNTNKGIWSFVSFHSLPICWGLSTNQNVYPNRGRSLTTCLPSFQQENLRNNDDKVSF